MILNAKCRRTVHHQQDLRIVSVPSSRCTFNMLEHPAEMASNRQLHQASIERLCYGKRNHKELGRSSTSQTPLRSAALISAIVISSPSRYFIVKLFIKLCNFLRSSSSRSSSTCSLIFCRNFTYFNVLYRDHLCIYKRIHFDQVNDTYESHFQRRLAIELLLHLHADAHAYS